MTSKALSCGAIYFAETCGKSITVGKDDELFLDAEWNRLSTFLFGSLIPCRRTNSGSFAILAAIRRASPLVSREPRLGRGRFGRPYSAMGQRASLWSSTVQGGGKRRGLVTSADMGGLFHRRSE